MSPYYIRKSLILIKNRQSGSNYNYVKTIDYELTSRHDYDYDSTSHSRIFSKTK